MTRASPVSTPRAHLVEKTPGLPSRLSHASTWLTGVDVERSPWWKRAERAQGAIRRALGESQAVAAAEKRYQRIERDPRAPASAREAAARRLTAAIESM